MYNIHQINHTKVSHPSKQKEESKERNLEIDVDFKLFLIAVYMSNIMCTILSVAVVCIEWREVTGIKTRRFMLVF